MGLSITIKRAVSLPLLYLTNIQSKYYVSERYLILMYHRIVEKNSSETWLQDGMYVDPNVFDMQIRYLKKKFTIVNLEDICKWEDSKHKFDIKKPWCILTFDDGWKDFYGYAYPILKSHNVSATVFLPTDLIGTAEAFWTESLAQILSNKECTMNNAMINNNISNEIAKYITNIDGTIDSKIEKAEEILKTLSNDEIYNTLNILADYYKVDAMISRDSFLSWEEIREMRDSGIVYFGSHTKSHQILTAVSEEVIREELLQSRNTLIEKNVVSPSFIPFSYPNGNYTDRIAEMVKESGYNLAVTTSGGWNKLSDSNNKLYKISRVGIHQDMSSTKFMFACRIYGIL